MQNLTSAGLEFCKDPFWDSELTWNSSWPQMTECFQSSFLLPLPCLFLWIYLPIHLHSLWKRPKKDGNLRSVLFMLKMVCCLVLASMETATIILRVQQHSIAQAIVSLVEPAAKLASFILVMFTVLLEHKKSAFRSPGLLAFFVFLLITHIVPLYSNIILQKYTTHEGAFVVFYIEYAAIICSVVLHCFNIKVSHFKATAAEESASILSTITIWWTTNLVIKGYKKPLTEEDIYPLNTSEKASTVVPAFLHNLADHTKLRKEKHRKELSLRVQTKARYSKADERVDTSTYPPLIGDNPEEKSGENLVDNGVLNFGETMVAFEDGTEKKGQQGLGVLLWKVILSTFMKHIIICCLLVLVVLACSLSNPIIMKFLIEFTSNEGEQEWHGYFLASILFILSSVSHLLFEFYMFQTNKFAMRVKSALVSAIYRKGLRLSCEARQSCSSGEVIHLLSKDCDSMWTLCNEGFILIESPIELIVGLVLVYHTVGVAMFSGLAAMGLLFVLKAFTVRKHAQYDQELRENADERMKLASQVFSGIKVLKLYAWEEAFKSLMCAVRKKELRAVFKYDLFRLFITFAWTAAIFWMIFFTFMTYIYVDGSHHLTASTVFVTMTYFTYIRRSSNSIASLIDIVIAGVNAGTRIARFLMLKEIEKTSSVVLSDEISEDSAVSIKDGYFSWTSTSKPVLKNINMDIPRGSLVAVVGMVGSGKSSLLSAILGEMEVHKGSVNKKGTIAYIPQQAWIQNDSLHNNVVFGGDDREKDYNQVIKACALEADLSVLPSGDKTEIGEKGINLSGGQKQRVSLARAVYQESDIYLFDDPLSAVDTHVGQHIFQQVIGKNGMLKDKTRILVTHGVHWLPNVDRILVLTNGQLTEQGSLEQLITHNGPFAQFLSQYLSQQHQQKNVQDVDDDCDVEDDDGNVDDDDGGRGDSAGGDAGNEKLFQEKTAQDIFERLISIESQNSEVTDFEITELKERKERNVPDAEETGKGSELVKLKDKDEDSEDESMRLIAEEEMASGRVNWSVYTTFCKCMGLVALAVLTFLYFDFFVFDLVSGFWLTFWVDDPLLNNISLPADSSVRAEENQYYLGIYSLWGILETLVIVIYSFLKAFRHVHASRIIHDTLITSILASPIQFFDTTPVGRVLARLSKDISVVDTTLLLFMEIWIHTVFGIMSVILIVVINLPVFLVVAIPVVLLFYVIEKFYLPTSCQLRRLESKWLSPVFSYTSESLAGSNVIRALGHENRFIQIAEQKIDFCQQMKYASLACERWLSMRLGFLSDLLVLFTGLLAVTYRNELTPGLIGLCLSMVLIITDEMQLQVRIASFLEMDIVSVERILQYSDLPSEAPRHLPCPECSESWPATGNIRFNNICVRYRPGLDLVLKSVSFQVQDGEKIGIVGRTGAGKSSLMLTLFRLLEPCDGNIVIDGLDISKLGLYQLRQKLTILPQDPVLFTGSLRSNFDPFEQFSDEEIWKSIEHCHLKSFVQTLPQGLEFLVGEGGDNLSIGQRQLVCLGRALLRKTKILVLDEATAAVDMETDELIQKTIRTEFQTCTVLTIAHRLHTILDYDRILVLDQGQIVEFDPPATLLSNTSTLFYHMAAETRALPSSYQT